MWRWWQSPPLLKVIVTVKKWRWLSPPLFQSGICNFSSNSKFRIKIPIFAYTLGKRIVFFLLPEAFCGLKYAWELTTLPGLQVNSALHPSGVAKSSTSFSWGKGGNVISAGWQVTLCDPMWHVSSRSGVATLRTAMHLLLTYLLTLYVRL